MRRLRDIHGFTLTEVTMTVLLIGIAATLVIPNLMGAKEHSKDSELSGHLSAAYQVAQEYFAGDMNPHYGASYTELESVTAREPNPARRLDNTFIWQAHNGDYGDHAPGVKNNAAALAPSASADPQRIIIHEANGTDLTLCNASKRVVLCVTDLGYRKAWGASTMGRSQAANAAKAPPSSPAGRCANAPGRAISFAVDGSCGA